jgi:hypothetical protein
MPLGNLDLAPTLTRFASLTTLSRQAGEGLCRLSRRDRHGHDGMRVKGTAMRRFWIRALGVLVLGSPIAGFAQAVETAGATQCKFSAWSADPDPAGLNVRAAARKDAPIVATLPHSKGYAVEFEVVGSLNGWLLIRNARLPTYDDAKDKPVFAGPGWVYADKVRFEINDQALRAQPQAEAPVVLPLFDEGSGPDSAEIDHVFGCQGTFADVEVHMSKGPHKRGWATRLCSNQVTTCV